MVVQEDAGDRQYHVVITAQGTATHWQARVHYYWYKKVGSIHHVKPTTLSLLHRGLPLIGPSSLLLVQKGGFYTANQDAAMLQPSTVTAYIGDI